ncbi:hypothetical protein BDW22DRAFT_1354893 [Trametopsis cervina]|nr:hypothetical protein BDW22DRAFT_1354893 [Trametopsis cervina]
MAVAIAVWSQALNPGEPIEYAPPADLKITSAALGDELADSNARSSVRLIYSAPCPSEDDEDDDEDLKLEPAATVLCSLTPGKIEQAALNIILEGGQVVAFENTGKNIIYLNGNFVDQVRQDDPPSDDELGIPDEEEALRLEDVSSDVEVEADELGLDEDSDVVMEEPKQKAKTAKESKKRQLESEGDGAQADETSKAEKKKLKKLKAEGGQPVLVGGESTVTEGTKEKKKDKKKDKKEKKEKEKGDDAGKKKDASKSTPSDAFKEIAGGVKVKDTAPGTGPEAKKGDTVHMRYTGKLDDGTVFDSNTKGKPFTFTLGDGDVIKGWDVGIVGMKAGGERVLVIPPNMGYGKRKQSGIPPSSTLTFDVKLVKIST